jgi:hypothetical protein
MTVRLEYRDASQVSYTNSWSFGVALTGENQTVVTGQWDFEKGDLSATFGKPLQYFDGPLWTH